MRFFIPQAKDSEQEAIYTSITNSIKEQMGWNIAERRIQRLQQLQDQGRKAKKQVIFEVGQLDPQEHRYQILAIFESNAYIVYSRTPDGFAGTTTLLDKTEISDVVEFEGNPSR